MSSRRTLILIVAIVVGALAAFAIYNYVQGVEDRANEDVERVQVIKVTGPIPQGITAAEARDQGLLQVDAAIAREFYPPNAVQDITEIEQKIAVTDLAPNQIVVQNMFVDRSNSLITNARRITTGNVAITISVDNVRGVAGLIVPGDFVNLMATSEGECSTAATGDDTTPTTAPQGAGNIFCNNARVVYQGAQVLFVDQSPVPLPGEQTVNADGTETAPQPTNAGLLTLSVPPEAAQRIASVSGSAWYLTLLPPDYSPHAIPPLTADEIVPGEDPSLLTPCGPQGCGSGNTP